MYQSLYRKYRPQVFDDLVGQTAIIKILKNSIICNKISHAYLFSGPRGTGKTSTAKIFAKSVNCLNLKDGESCGKCSNCKEINSGAAVDIIEIDAASNNGVDEIRELRSNINLSCASLKYKVYIIDEVHMLSTGAFNALLKTLEEPPEHVIFILATTDPQKVPSTIISRCQCYAFEQIAIKDILTNLKMIASKESIIVSDEILEKIAINSNGGMRDALGLLEKVGLYGENITMEDFNRLCGFVSGDDIDKFIEALFTKDKKSLVNIVNDRYYGGINLVVFFNQIINKMKLIMLDNIDDKNNARKIVRFIKAINNIILTIKTSDNPCVVAIALLLDELIDGSGDNTNNNIKKHNVEKNVVEKTDDIKTEKSVPMGNFVIKNDIIINNTFATAEKNKLLDMKRIWKDLNNFILDSNYGSNVSFLLDATICAVGDNDMILSFDYSSMVDRAKSMYDSLIKTILKLLKTKTNIAFITSDEWKNIKSTYIKKIKGGYVYKIKNVNPIIEIQGKQKDNKGSTELQEADIIFGDDIVEYE